jgi:hypothetical protein
MRLPKPDFGAGVTEVPGELQGGDFDLHGLERCSGVACGCPQALGTDAESGEDDGEQCERDVLDRPEVARAVAATGEEADEQDDVSDGGGSEDDPEAQEQLVVECGLWALASVGRSDAMRLGGGTY